MKLLSAFTTFIFLLGAYLFLPKPVQAQVGGICQHSITQQKVVLNTASTTVTIGIDSSWPQTTCTNEFQGNCVGIRFCRYGARVIGGCTANSSSWVENQVITDENGIRVIKGTTGILEANRQFWLEVHMEGVPDDWNNARVGSRQNFCPGNYRRGNGPKVEVVDGVCRAGWMTVSNQNGENKILPGDSVQLTFDGTKTSGFLGGFAAHIKKPDGSFDRRGSFDAGIGDFTQLYAVNGNVFEYSPDSPGTYTFMVTDAIGGAETYCEHTFNVCDPTNSSCRLNQSSNKGDVDNSGNRVIIPIEPFSICGQLTNEDQKLACERCTKTGSFADTDPVAAAAAGQTSTDGNPKAMYTALGCIPIGERDLIRTFIQLLLSVSGMVALLSILAGAFLLSTSQGDSNKVKTARELITAAVSGLLFIIFSTIILDFIGVQILRIPGLG